MSDMGVNEAKDEQHVPPYPIRRRRHLRLALVITLSIALALLIGQFFILPMLFRQQIEQALHEAGVDAVRFRVARATLWGAELTDLAAGDGHALNVDRIALDFSLRDLRNGRLKAIRIIGATIRVAVHEGAFDLSPLRSLIVQRPAAATHPTSSSGGALPIGRIELTQSKAILITEKQPVTVPIGGSLVPHADGRWSISLQIAEERAFVLGAEVKDQQATFAGSADPGRTLLTVRAIWPGADVSADGSLKVSGQLNWKDRPVTGQARLEILPDSGIAAPPSHAAKLHLSSGVFDVNTSFGGDGGNRPTLRVVASKVAIAMAGFSTWGVNGEVALSSFSPLASPPSQKLTADGLKIGDMQLSSGVLDFRMNGSSNMLVHHTQWTWLGGSVWADDFVISGQPLQITLHAENVELKDLLALTASEKASGQGKLSGEIPVTIDGADVQFGTGSISAAQGGNVQIKDMTAIEPTAAAAAHAASATSSEQIKKNVIEALSDFQYETLSMKLDSTDKGLVGHVRMKGHGRTGAKQALDYELNVTGLDKALRSYLRIREGLSLPHPRPQPGTLPATSPTTGKAEGK
jgi:hypothetical protein